MLWTVQHALLVVSLGHESAMVGKCKYMSTQRVCVSLEELPPFKALPLSFPMFSRSQSTTFKFCAINSDFED